MCIYTIESIGTDNQQTMKVVVNLLSIHSLYKISNHLILLVIYCNNIIRNEFVYKTENESNKSMLNSSNNFYLLIKLSETKVFYHTTETNKSIMSNSELKSLFTYTLFAITSAMEIY